jgi:hypothetical protein
MTFSILFCNTQIATITAGKPYGLFENGALVIYDDWSKKNQNKK